MSDVEGSRGGAPRLSRELIVERDSRIFELKKSGLSNDAIARKFGMSATAVGAAVRRRLERLNSDTFLSYPEVLRLELERLDELQRGVWPLTQFRREVLDDGGVVVLEPDQNAVRTVLGIMDRRARLLGLVVERAEVAVSGVSGDDGVRSSLVGGRVVDVGVVGDVRGESLRMLELMVSSGVLDEGVVGRVLGEVEGGVEGGFVGSVLEVE